MKTEFVQFETRLTAHDILMTPEYKGATNLPYDPHGWVDGSPIWTDLINQLKPKRIAEVGVWMGMTTRYFCSFSFVEEVVCVDHWNAHLIDNNSIDMSQQPTNRNITMYDQFLSNCYHSGIWNTVYPMRMVSVEGAKQCMKMGLQFDMIWIDADHSTKGVKEDIAVWMPLLAPNGLMCGDDFGWISEPYSVKNAVIESAPLFNMKVNSNGNFWWYTKV